MSLLHKVALDEFKKTKYPEYENKIQEAAGNVPLIEVDWNSFVDESFQTGLYADALPKVFFLPLVEGLKVITSSDIGKEAVKAKLNKIVIKNTDSFYGQEAYSFADGVLTVDHKPFTNVNDEQTRIDAVILVLSKNL